MSHVNLPVFENKGYTQEAWQLCQRFRSHRSAHRYFDSKPDMGVQPLKRNSPWLFGRHFFGHLDLPRMQESAVTGAMWSITTNPFRSAKSRWNIFNKNIEK